MGWDLGSDPEWECEECGHHWESYMEPERCPKCHCYDVREY